MKPLLAALLLCAAFDAFGQTYPLCDKHHPCALVPTQDKGISTLTIGNGTPAEQAGIHLPSKLDIDKQGHIAEPKAEIWNCGGDSCPIVIDCANLPGGKCPTLYDFTYHWVNPPELEARFQAQERELKSMRRDVERLRKLLEAK